MDRTRQARCSVRLAARLPLVALLLVPLAPRPASAQPTVTVRPAPPARGSAGTRQEPGRSPRRRCPVPVPAGAPCPVRVEGSGGVHVEGRIEVRLPGARAGGHAHASGGTTVEASATGEAGAHTGIGTRSGAGPEGRAAGGRASGAASGTRSRAPAWQPRWDPWDYDAEDFPPLRPCREGEPFGSERDPEPRCRPPWQGSGLPWQLRIDFPLMPAYVWGLGAATNRVGLHHGLELDFWFLDELGLGLEARLLDVQDGWSDEDGDGEDDDGDNLYVGLLGGGLRWRLWTDAIAREGWTLRLDGLRAWPSAGYGLSPGWVLGVGFERHFGGLEVDGWSWELGFGGRYLHGLGGMEGLHAITLQSSLRFGWGAREPDEYDGNPPRPEGLHHFVGFAAMSVFGGGVESGGAALRLGFPALDGWLEGRLQLGVTGQAWRLQEGDEGYFTGGAWHVAGGARFNAPLFFMGMSTLVTFHLEGLVGVRAGAGSIPRGTHLLDPFGTAVAGFSLVFDDLRFDLISGGIRTSLLADARTPRLEGILFGPIVTIDFGDFRGTHTARRRVERRRRAAESSCWLQWRERGRLSSRCEDLIGADVRAELAARRRRERFERSRASGSGASATGAARSAGAGVEVHLDASVGGHARGGSPRLPMPPASPATEFHLGVFAHGTLQALAWDVLPWGRIGAGARVEIHAPAVVGAAVRGLFLAEASRRGVHVAAGQVSVRATSGIQVKVVVRDR